jgi:hypothetical protein
LTLTDAASIILPEVSFMAPVRVWLALAVAAAVALAVGCEIKRLPTTPSEFKEGILIYQLPTFSGDSSHLTTDVRDLSNYGGPCDWGGFGGVGSSNGWGDCIQAIKVAPGWRATVYQDDSFKGKSLEVTADLPDLGVVSGPCGGHWAHCISSIRVSRQ